MAEITEDKGGISPGPGSLKRGPKSSKGKSTWKHMTTRRMRANTQVKGDRSDIATFLSCYDSEPRVAAYLGYRDLAEYRKCIFSFHVIDYFNIYFKHCMGGSGKVALELIRDLPNLESLLPNAVSEAITQYTVPSKATSAEQQKLEDETNMNYLMATILFRLAHALKSPPSYTDEELSQRQAAAAENSSDVEISPPRPNKCFENAGQLSIQQLVDNAVADRSSSKKEVRALTFTKGTPQQQHNHT